MNAHLDEITPVAAAQVLWTYDRTRPGGYPPGGFTEALINAICRADPYNRELLRRGFPEYVRAREVAEFMEGGLDILATIAARGTA